MSEQESLSTDISAAIDRLSENSTAENTIETGSVAESEPESKQDRSKKQLLRSPHVVTFSTGLVLGLVSLAGLWQLQLVGSPQSAQQNVPSSYYYGSLVPANISPPGPASESLFIDNANITGDARAVYADQKVLVRLSLQTSTEIEIILLYGDQLWCQGYRTSIEAKQSLATDDNQARMTIADSGDLEIVLHDNDNARPPVTLVLRSGSQIVYEGMLKSRL